MGLLSKIKKKAKGLLSGAKKIFKKGVAAFAKALSNKWVRGALLVTSLVVPALGMATAGWASAAGQGFAAQASAALGNVAKGVASMVVKAVTTPVKMLLNGGANVANAVGAEGLATTLSSTATSVGNTATSIFGNIKQDSIGQIVNRFTGTPASAVTETAQTIPTAEGAAAPADVAAAPAPGAAAQAPAGTAAAPAAKTGLLNKSLAFVEKHPELTKMAAGMVQGAMTPSEEDIANARYKAQSKYQQGIDNQWSNFNSGAVPLPGTTPAPAGQPPINRTDYDARARAAREDIESYPAVAYQPTRSLLQKPDFMRNY